MVKSEDLRVGILGVGYHMPDEVITNDDLSKLVDTTDEWILERTGIRERRRVAPGETTSMIGAKAARKAIANAGLAIDDIDAILVATFSPDYLCPNTASLIQRELEPARPIPALDMDAACSGFIYALTMAEGMIRTLGYRNVLVVGAESLTRFVDYTDRTTCILFGDGAGAAVVGRVEAPRGFLGHYLGADGKGARLIRVECGGSARPSTAERLAAHEQYLKVEGKEVFKFAVKVLGEAVDKALEAAGMKPTEIDLLIPHQANHRIIDAAAKRYNMPLERVMSNVDKYGNTSAASVPIAMAEAWEQGRIRPGMVLAIVAFGGGLTYGASILRW